VCDEIVSTYAQHEHAIILEITQKYQIEMQISTIKIKIFENRLGTHLIGPK
jgi:hypothetical protein